MCTRSSLLFADFLALVFVVVWGHDGVMSTSKDKKGVLGARCTHIHPNIHHNLHFVSSVTAPRYGRLALIFASLFLCFFVPSSTFSTSTLPPLHSSSLGQSFSDQQSLEQMVFNIRNLFLSDSQKQVEAEVRNIGLAHTIRDVITGIASITIL